MSRILYKDVPPEIKARIKELSGDKYDEEKVGQDYDRHEALTSKTAFDYHFTPERFEFWKNVMNYQKFDEFFKKYPKSSSNSKEGYFPNEKRPQEKEGTNYIVTKQYLSFCSPGDIITLNRNDGSRIPNFINSRGQTFWYSWSLLKPSIEVKSVSSTMEDCPYPEEALGTEYEVVNTTEKEYYNIGDIVKFHFNDNSRAPKFYNGATGEIVYIPWKNLKRITISETTNTSKKYRYKTEAECGGKLPSGWINDMKKYYGQKLTESEVKVYEAAKLKGGFKATFIGSGNWHFSVSDVIEINSETILNLNTVQHGKESSTNEPVLHRVPPAVTYGTTPRGVAISCARSKICLGG